MDRRHFVKQATLAAAAAAALLPNDEKDWSDFSRLCDERERVTLRVDFDANGLPYLYIEETGQLVHYIDRDFEVCFEPGGEGSLQRVRVTQTVITDKRLRAGR